MDWDLRALPRKRHGTAALVMSKRLESKRRKDSVGGTWPHQKCGNARIWKEQSFLSQNLPAGLAQMIVTRERSE